MVRKFRERVLGMHNGISRFPFSGFVKDSRDRAWKIINSKTKEGQK